MQLVPVPCPLSRRTSTKGQRRLDTLLCAIVPLARKTPLDLKHALNEVSKTSRVRIRGPPRLQRRYPLLASTSLRLMQYPRRDAQILGFPLCLRAGGAVSKSAGEHLARLRARVGGWVYNDKTLSVKSANSTHSRISVACSRSRWLC